MKPVLFNWIQKDAKLTIEKVDEAINGKLDIGMIEKLLLEVGSMIGRIRERTKDLIKKPKPIYGELLQELERRHHKLYNITIRWRSEKVEMQRGNLIIKCPYENIVKQGHSIMKKENVRSKE